LVTTVESFPWDSIEYLIEKHDPLFVLDEFHLFYQWGKDFRPNLYEIFQLLILSKARTLGLTATLEATVKEELVTDLNLNEITTHFIDIGNFEFKTKPSAKKYHLSKRLISERFLYYCHFFKKGRILIFVRTRKEARDLKTKLLKRGVDCSICLGGEVRNFIKDEYIDKKKVIIATSALSHGVNLVNIRKVFLTYEPTEFMKAQMIGRGGRYGESFNVYLLANNEGRTSLIEKLIYQVKLWTYQIINHSITVLA
jgi:superfamily II DNA helicase RecQ